jgi:hypothetical protein
MAIDNPIFIKLQSAITPIVSVGVGSAIISACKKKGLSPQKLEKRDLPVLKEALLELYQEFWAQKLGDIKTALASI